MTPQPIHVLFLCTGNSARSILAECLLRHHGGPRFRAASAGSRPTGRVHPLALAVLAEAGIDTMGVESKDQDRFAASDGLDVDVVITVCDKAAGEMCPVFPGTPGTVHWGLEDPAAFVEPDAALHAFRLTRDRLDAWIHRMVGMPLETLSPGQMQSALQDLADAPADGSGN